MSTGLLLTFSRQKEFRAEFGRLLVNGRRDRASKGPGAHWYSW
jgi:hypothetical protein